jgi:hypothetical protein
MAQAGVIVTDYCTVAVEILKDNASSNAGALYGALDMPFAGLVGQLAAAFAKAALIDSTSETRQESNLPPLHFVSLSFGFAHIHRAQA